MTTKNTLRELLDRFAKRLHEDIVWSTECDLRERVDVVDAMVSLREAADVLLIVMTDLGVLSDDWKDTVV